MPSRTVFIPKKKNNGHLPTAFTAFISQQISRLPRWDQDQAPCLTVGPPPHSLHLLPRQLPAEAEHTSGDPRRLHGEQQSVVAAVTLLLITPLKPFEPELFFLFLPFLSSSLVDPNAAEWPSQDRPLLLACFAGKTTAVLLCSVAWCKTNSVFSFLFKLKTF